MYSLTLSLFQIDLIRTAFMLDFSSLDGFETCEKCEGVSLSFGIIVCILGWGVV